jgi:hypothetical protein
VYQLVDRIDDSSAKKPASAPKAASGTPERQRGPLVGASVRVEGLGKDED